MTGTPLIDGITTAIVGASDPRRHLGLYRDRLGFQVEAHGVVPTATARALWGTTGGDVPVAVLSAAGARSGRIALLTIPDADPATAEHPHTADFGLVGIDVYTRDIDASYRELTAAGYPWASPPARYQVPLGDRAVSVTEGFCLAPDGTDLVLVQPASPRGTEAWAADPGRAYTELTSVVCHVPDVDAELEFWGSRGLGLELWYDVTFSSPGLEAMAGLPAGTRMRLGFLAGPRTARIEVTGVRDNPGRVDRRARQRPGHALGHSGWVARTGDLDAALACCAERGGLVLTTTVVTDDPLFGSARAASVDTPGGIPLTLYEVTR